MEEFQRIILVHYHEIGLKGRNRGVFETRLQKNLEALLGAYPAVSYTHLCNRMADMVAVQEALRGCALEDMDAEAFQIAKRYGLSDAEIAVLTLSLIHI